MTRLMLRTQIVLLPVVAAIAFVLLIVLNLALGQQRGHLANIEKGYLPAFAVTREAENLLRDVRRVLQDATVAQDEEQLTDADAKFALLLQKIDLLIANPTQNKSSLRAIRKNVERYFKFARAVTLAMIRNQVSEQLEQDTQSMMSQYNQVRDQLAVATTHGQRTMREAFRAAYDANVLSTNINVFIAAIALILLIAIAFLVIRGVVGALTAAVKHLSAASTEIVSMSKRTENNAMVEATAINETQRTTVALVTAAHDIAVSASEVQTQSERSSEASQLIIERIAALNEQARKITQISDTITGIAHESNLLAFNASLEGVKAGDAGRGFVVVADKMRRVAEMVIAASREINGLTNGIRQHCEAAMTAANDGSRLAETTTELSKRITLITSQQQTGTEQVSRNMEDIQQFTQQTSSGVAQFKTTADDLVNTAINLTGLLSGRRNGRGQNN